MKRFRQQLDVQSRMVNGRGGRAASFVRPLSVDQTASVHLLIVFETLHEKLSPSQFSSFGKLGDHYLAGLLQRNVCKAPGTPCARTKNGVLVE